jgi:DNA mismatch endonuclease, patch repair protein
MADNLTPDQRRRSMAAIRAKNTKPELALRRALWAAELRGYRLHRRDLPGRPDIVFSRARIAIFVDGAFWHGHPSAFTRGKSGSYWDQKIARNMARDVEANASLVAQGWTVIRFWDFELRRHLYDCVALIGSAFAASEGESGDLSGAVGRMHEPDER